MNPALTAETTPPTSNPNIRLRLFFVVDSWTQISKSERMRRTCLRVYRMDAPEIRQASVGESRPLTAVYRSAYQENRELGLPASAESVSPATVADWIQEYRVDVATVNGEIGGGVRLEATTTDRAKLSRFGVHEEYKDEGIGSALLDHAEKQARDRGYGTVWLTTAEEHPHLPAFYQRYRPRTSGSRKSRSDLLDTGNQRFPLT